MPRTTFTVYSIQQFPFSPPTVSTAYRLPRTANNASRTTRLQQPISHKMNLLGLRPASPVRAAAGQSRVDYNATEAHLRSLKAEFLQQPLHNRIQTPGDVLGGLIDLVGIVGQRIDRVGFEDQLDPFQPNRAVYCWSRPPWAR